MWCEHDAPEDCEDGAPWARYVLVPDGYALMPVEPTNQMYRADVNADINHLKEHGVGFNLRFKRFSERYKAVLAAAQDESQ
jgi:hypothetical protein